MKVAATGMQANRKSLASSEEAKGCEVQSRKVPERRLTYKNVDEFKNPKDNTKPVMLVREKKEGLSK